MTNRTGLVTVLVALLVVLAGCAGGAGTLTDATRSDGRDGTQASGDAASTGGGSAVDTGTVNFYVSDERNAIADFEHLNVTVERVTFVRAGDGAGDDEDADAPENESNATATTTTTTANAEETTDANATNTTATSTATTTEAAEADESPGDGDDESDASSESESESESDAGDGGNVAYDVENVTVDLTELQGDNASLVGAYDVPEGTYAKVFVHVSDVEGTLKTGERVTVKLPSEKLQLDSQFAVQTGESVDFVFDITAFEAGKSGKYVLKPVVTESGTDVPIEDVDERREASDDTENENENENHAADDARADGESEGPEAHADDDAGDVGLNASFAGDVTPGANATLAVTQNGTPVENATVVVNDESAGTTKADGELVVEIPDADEVTVDVRLGDAEAELEFEFADREEKKPDEAGTSQG